MCRVGTTSVARIRENSSAVGSLWSVAAMIATGIANENRFFLNLVAMLSMSGTRIDRVCVVEASTNGEPFDNSVAHVESVDNGDNSGCKTLYEFKTRRLLR